MSLDRRTTNPGKRERRNKWSRKYYKKHPEKWKKRYEANKEKRKKRAKNYRLSLRMQALREYGAICKCCGETQWEFLSIDHINGDGAKHRRENNISRSTDLFLWLKRNNYPEGFQILCFNCNLSKGHLGYCPHKNMVKP